MGEFYLFSDRLMILCVMISACAVVTQTTGISSGFRRLGKEHFFLPENILEIAILLHLMVLAMISAEASMQAKAGFVYPSRYVFLRYLLFFVMSGLAAYVVWQRRIFQPMAVPLAAALTLPATEYAAGRLFPGLFFLLQFYWLLRCFHMLLLRKRQQKGQLSLLSVKEAVDNLDSGLLFYQTNGQVLLQNSCMQKLMLSLTGKFQYNGTLFYEALREGRVSADCKKDKIGGQLAYHLSDGRVWVFDLYPIQTEKDCLLLTASDITERWKATQELMERNRELAKRNRELTEMMKNLETICKTEETISAKSRVHDVLGQRISLLLRAIREHREPDEVLLRSFAEGLPEELTKTTEEGSYPLETLTEIFRGLGVSIHIEGSLPKEKTAGDALFRIAAEAVTNAVRHGYASEVSIVLSEENNVYRMTVSDSGIPPEGEVIEGGGLREMRRSVTELGGSFSYETTPGFCIRAEIPKGGAV